MSALEERIKVVILLLGSVAAPALAATLLPPQFVLPEFREVRNRIVAAPPVPAIDRAPFLTPRGTGLDGVGVMVISTPAGQFLCSGSLLTAAGKPFFLTAAHCVADENGVLWADQVDITLFPDPSGAVTRSTTERNRIFVHPSYDGEVISNFDIALIYLAGFGLESVPGLEFYELYSGPLTTEEYTVVGFGDRGDGVTGPTLPGGSRRQGFNQFDFLFGPGILVSDFDNGEPVNDGSALFGFPGLGLGARESSTAPGDSGGPVFFGNRIVGLTSFGATAGPVSDGGTDIDDDLNSSFGEFAGFVYTGFLRNWVESVAISIPEPSTGPLAVLAVTGILLIRRRRP